MQPAQPIPRTHITHLTDVDMVPTGFLIEYLPAYGRYVDVWTRRSLLVWATSVKQVIGATAVNQFRPLERDR